MRALVLLVSLSALGGCSAGVPLEGARILHTLPDPTPGGAPRALTSLVSGSVVDVQHLASLAVVRLDDGGGAEVVARVPFTGDGEGTVGGLALSGKTLFAVNRRRNLAFDLTDPLAPRLVRDDGSFGGAALALVEGRLVVATESAVEQYDVSDPVAWVKRASHALGFPALDHFTLSHDSARKLLFVGARSTFTVLPAVATDDVWKRSAAQEAGGLVFSVGGHVGVHGRRAYFCDSTVQSRGLHAFEVTSPDSVSAEKETLLDGLGCQGRAFDGIAYLLVNRSAVQSSLNQLVKVDLETGRSEDVDVQDLGQVGLNDLTTDGKRLYLSTETGLVIIGR